VSASPVTPQQIRQLHKVDRHAPRFVFRQQVGRCASARFILEINQGQRYDESVLDCVTAESY
jgi:hypothetical protein